MAKKLFLVMIMALASLSAVACGDDGPIVNPGTDGSVSPDGNIKVDGGDAGRG